MGQTKHLQNLRFNIFWIEIIFLHREAGTCNQLWNFKRKHVTKYRKEGISNLEVQKYVQTNFQFELDLGPTSNFFLS